MSFNPFINGGGGTSSEDKVARAEIAAIKDGETLDSFSDVETALADKADITDIPTVPITAIQKNDTDIVPVSGTVNITVPTTAADVSALPDTTKYAASLSLTINSSTFVMTGQLKDQNGDNLGTAQTIDLPLESVVVGGSYDSQTKKVVLTLQNGNTIEFSVADLVSGLQTELSASNKLNPAYINYDSTHRAVSDAEKTTWNGKQDALTTEQLAAVNSGITSADVEQITTNENNILLAYGGKVGKNVAKPNKISAISGITIVQNMGHYEISGTTGDSPYVAYLCVSAEGIIATEALYVSAAAVCTNVFYRCTWENTHGEIRTASIGTRTGLTIQQGCKIYTLSIEVVPNMTFSFNLDMMICKKAIYDADPTYQPYVMNNIELTAKEQANENNISWNTNNGVKNLLNFDTDTMKSINTGGTWSGDTWSLGNNVTLTINPDKSITLNGTANAGKTVYLTKNLGMAENAYTLSTGALTAKLWAGIIEVGGTENNYTGSTTHLDKTCQPNHITLYVENGCTLSNLTIYPMLTLKSLYDADPTYQHYALSNAELTAKEQQNENNISLIDSINPFSVYSIDEKIMTGTGFVIPENTAVKMPKGEYTLSFASNAATTATFVIDSGSTEIFRITLSIVSGNNSFNFTLSANGDKIRLFASSSCTITELSIVPKIYRDNGYTDYVTQALPNTIITPALKECVDNGVKNLFQVTGTATTGFGVTLTWNYSEGYVTVNGTSAPSGAPAIYFALGSWTAPKDGYYVIASVNANSPDVLIYNDQTWATWKTQTWNPVRYFTKGTTMMIFLRITAGTVCNNLKVYPMICTKAAWDADPTYQHYALSNAELTAKEQVNKNNISWNYTETSYSPNNANVYEYTGISFTVPANEVYEFYAADRNDSSVNDIFSTGIIVADNSSNVTLKASTIAENSGTPAQAPNFWLRTVNGITPKRNQNTTYYIWVNRTSTSTSGRIILAYRKMVII